MSKIIHYHPSPKLLSVIHPLVILKQLHFPSLPTKPFNTSSHFCISLSYSSLHRFSLTFILLLGFLFSFVLFSRFPLYTVVVLFSSVFSSLPLYSVFSSPPFSSLPPLSCFHPISLASTVKRYESNLFH